MTDVHKVVCEYCGGKNWANQLSCINCGASLPDIENSYNLQNLGPAYDLTQGGQPPVLSPFIEWNMKFEGETNA